MEIEEEITKKLKLVCISDTHNWTQGLFLPPGDILIHAGDFTKYGLPSEIQAFNTFLESHPYKYKLIIAGNHDFTFDISNYFSILHRRQLKNKDISKHKGVDPKEACKLLTDAIYLEDSLVEINGFKFYGSPWSPEKSTSAFKLAEGDKIMEKWKAIPEGIDVLITHTPPFGILDKTKAGVNAGCKALLKEVKERIRPKVHIFGHIHDGYGIYKEAGITFVNACSWNFKEKKSNEPFIIDLQK